jgi:hypothetical protein
MRWEYELGIAIIRRFGKYTSQPLLIYIARIASVTNGLVERGLMPL